MYELGRDNDKEEAYECEIMEGIIQVEKSFK